MTRKAAKFSSWTNSRPRWEKLPLPSTISCPRWENLLGFPPDSTKLERFLLKNDVEHSLEVRLGLSAKSRETSNSLTFAGISENPDHN
jgi:hypothetical protein